MPSSILMSEVANAGFYALLAAMALGNGLHALLTEQVPFDEEESIRWEIFSTSLAHKALLVPRYSFVRLFLAPNADRLFALMTLDCCLIKATFTQQITKFVVCKFLATDICVTL